MKDPNSFLIGEGYHPKGKFLFCTILSNKLKSVQLNHSVSGGPSSGNFEYVLHHELKGVDFLDCVCSSDQ